MATEKHSTNPEFTPLLRPEAVRFRAFRLEGEVFVAIRSPWKILGFITVALVCVVAAVAGFSSYSTTIRVAGALVSNISEDAQVPSGEPIVGTPSTPLLFSARLSLPANAAFFVRPGQEVLISYDAFPQRRFGKARGTILSVQLTPPTSAATSTQEAGYSAMASLDRDFVYAYGEKIPLRAGMTLAAEIALREQSSVEWLFEPLYATRSEQ